MPVVATHGPGNWANYHGTGMARHAGRHALRSDAAVRGRDAIAAASADLQRWLGEAQAQGRCVRPIGAGWSPSNIQIADDGWLLNTRRFNRCYRIGSDDVMASVDAAGLMLVEAGTLVDEVADKFESFDRSLWTSGAGNGQTFAGACATATHGSMIDRGGIQDHVRAVQIVTPSARWWIEPAAGVMSDAFIAATGSQPIRDDGLFAAAQVPVGALGIVTAYVLDSVPRFLVRPIQMLRRVPRDQIDWLEQGDFTRFSAAHALDRRPDFVQAIFNPYRPHQRPAMLRFLYRHEWSDDAPQATPAQLGAGHDALTLLGRLLDSYPFARGWLLQQAMRLGYANGPGPDDPPVFGSWGDSLDTHRPLADLFNASVTVDRADLGRALDIIFATYARAGGSTVVTLRFMARAQGLLAPARFPHNAVIDFDGPRSDRTAAAYARVVAALDSAGIAFTRHWAKSCSLDADRVRADYGNSFAMWCASRDRLLPEQDRALFRCPALDGLGLTG